MSRARRSTGDGPGDRIGWALRCYLVAAVVALAAAVALVQASSALGVEV